MSLARFTDPISIIVASLEAGRRGKRTDRQQPPETLEHVASLIRQGCSRGIVPQWVLRKAPGVEFSTEELHKIADYVEESFISGEFEPDDDQVIVREGIDGMIVHPVSRAWRIEFYE